MKAQTMANQMMGQYYRLIIFLFFITTYFLLVKTLVFKCDVMHYLCILLTSAIVYPLQ